MGEVENALRSVSEFAKVPTLMVAGRTDKGVNATGQVLPHATAATLTHDSAAHKSHL